LEGVSVFTAMASIGGLPEMLKSLAAPETA